MLTYKSATQSGILSIALHYDLPVIATDTGGMKEVIDKYGVGEIIENAESNLIAESVNDFYKNGKDYYQKIKEYKDLASWKNLAHTIIKLK
jgi:glycosyltransferase involved in cell wall biosynthesis